MTIIANAAMVKYRVNPPRVKPRDSETGLTNTPMEFMIIPMPAKLRKKAPTTIHHP